MSQNIKNRIAIFFYEGYISVSPTIQSVVSYFRDKGYAVDLFMRELSVQYAPDTEYNGGQIYRFPYILPRIHNIVDTIINKLSLRDYFGYAHAHQKFRYISGCVRKCKADRYDFFIGVDWAGIIAAGKASKGKVPLVYLSLEILDTIKTHFDSVFKKQEIFWQKKALCTIIQDEYRRDCLARINVTGIKNHRYFIVPNSPRGFEKHKRNYFFNERFGIDRNEFIVLSAGMIHDAVFSKDIAGQVPAGSGYTMVFHDRQFRDIDSDSYLQEIKNIGGQRLVLSLQPVPYEQLCDIYSSADAGLVVYNKAYGDNFENIVGASGKMSHCLKYGLPIIALDLPGFSEIILKYRCGVLIRSIDELNGAVETIKRNHAEYRNNAVECYKREYEFDTHFDKVFNVMKELR